MTTTPESSRGERRLQELRQALGGRAPERFTQEAFDGDDGHLRRLIRLAPGELAAPGDLWDYTQDLLYAKDIDTPLLVSLLPACLQAWHLDLRGVTDAGQHGYGAFVEHFYPALADRVFEQHLTPKQAEAVAAFLRASIIEEIDDQRGLAYDGANARPCRWIEGLTTYGVLRPDIDALWNSWWAITSPGAAIAVIQYTSALIYPNAENPIFAPWTRDSGGGPPCLWEFGGHLYEHRWLAANVEFLTRALTAPAVCDVLRRAVAVLAKESGFEHESAVAAHIEAGLGSRMDTLEARCAELPVLLARPSSEIWEWTR